MKLNQNINFADNFLEMSQYVVLETILDAGIMFSIREIFIFPGNNKITWKKKHKNFGLFLAEFYHLVFVLLENPIMVL